MRLIDTSTGLPLPLPLDVQVALILIGYYTCRITLEEIEEHARR